MKIKNVYILRTVAGQNIVIPTDDKTSAFQGALTLNDTGAFLWKTLESECTRDELISSLTDKYDVDEKKAAESVDRMLKIFDGYGVLEK